MRRPLFTILWCLTTVLSFTIGSAFDYHSVRGRSPRPEIVQRIEAENMYYPQPARLQLTGKRLPEWSNRTQVLWDGLPGEQMKLIFRIDQAGEYRLAIKLTSGLDYAKINIALDGETIATDIDTYSNVTELMSLLQLGQKQLSPGNHQLALKVVGINPKVKEVNDPDTYLVGVDYLELGLLGETPAQTSPHQSPIETSAATGPSAALSFHDMQAAMSEHCYHCHNADKKKGDVDLKSLDSIDDYLANIELTRLVSESIEYGEMPPEKEPAIPSTKRQQMLDTTEKWIDQYLAREARLPVVTMRRLNRYEYNNAVKDLFELRGDIYPLPEKAIRSDIPYFDPKSGKFPDSLKLGNRPLGKRQVEEPFLTGVVPYSVDLQAEHGFNNYGDQLSLSPILMEAFLKLSHSIINAPEFAEYSRAYDRLFSPPSGADDPVAVGSAHIRDFLYRAFRSAPGDSAARFTSFFEAQLAAGQDYSSAMRSTISGILASPRFLYLVEEQSEDAELPLTSYELASRLSFFLWSTIPDAQLLESAESGALLTDAGLHQQVSRMLESPRSQALSHNFARQWLRLDGLINAIPDYDRFTHYYSRFGCEQFKFGLHAMAEPLLLFESIMVEDRSIMLLVDSDYTWRTDSMETWYGKPNTPFTGLGENRFETYQSVYHKRRLTTRRQGGVMTTAAMLTMTSDPLRTNPINRGAWTLTVMFNQPPPPPPDAVPEIEADDAAIEAQGLTLRQRLKEHQENESCASCHSKIDPLGFAFENYDAVGRWRDNYSSGLPIDASGDLFGGAEFDDVVGFKDAMLERPELFIHGFCEHMLSYALGRKLSVADQPAIDEIVAAVLNDHGQFTTVIHRIVQSYPFQHKSQYRPISGHKQQQH